MSMRFIGDVLIDFCLFSLIECFILYLNLKNIYKIKLKNYDVIFISFLLSITKFLIPNILKQFCLIILIILYLKIKSNIKILNCVKIVLIFYSLLLVIETFYFMICIELLNLEYLLNNNFQKFLIMLPIRIFEFVLLTKENLLWEAFGGEKTQKKK